VQRTEEITPSSPRRAAVDRQFQLLRAALLVLRAGPALILLLLVIAISITTPVFATSHNLGNVLAQTAVIATLAMGQLFVIVTRGVDLSVGSTLALATVVGSIVFSHIDSSLLVILAIIGTGALVGAVNGVVFVLGRVPHAFIVTLATLSIGRGMALWLSDGEPKTGMPSAVQAIGSDTVSWIPYSAFLVAGLAAIVAVACSLLVFGRRLYAVGGNPDAARRAGIPVRRMLIGVYVLSGIAAGIGGVITAGRTNAGSPNFGELAELDSIAAVIIGGVAFAGGRGNVGNALVGAFTIGVIRNALDLHSVDVAFQLIAIGVIVTLAVEADVVRRHVEDRFRVARAARLG
jgi:ribose transport system permease protein